MKVLRFLSVIGLTFLFGANAVAVTPRFLEADKLLAGDGTSEDFFGYSAGLKAIPPCSGGGETMTTAVTPVLLTFLPARQGSGQSSRS